VQQDWLFERYLRRPDLKLDDELNRLDAKILLDDELDCRVPRSSSL
jgi:hypothetical protein